MAEVVWSETATTTLDVLSRVRGWDMVAREYVRRVAERIAVVEAGHVTVCPRDVALAIMAMEARVRHVGEV